MAYESLRDYLSFLEGKGALARIYMAAREGRGAGAGPPVLFWAALGFGMLIKGPIAPVIAALTLAALKLSDRSTPLLRPLRPAWGVPLALAFVTMGRWTPSGSWPRMTTWGAKDSASVARVRALWTPSTP